MCIDRRQFIEIGHIQAKVQRVGYSAKHNGLGGVEGNAVRGPLNGKCISDTLETNVLHISRADVTCICLGVYTLRASIGQRPPVEIAPQGGGDERVVVVQRRSGHEPRTAVAAGGERIDANRGCEIAGDLAIGEGGIILSNNEELAERCWSIHNVGRVRQGAWYQHETWGSNFRMTQWQAAILLAQMTRLEEQSARREETAAYLSQELSKLGLRPLRRDPRVTQHAWHIYIFRYTPSLARGATREQFIQAMNAEGIPCASGYVPLYATNAVRNGVADTLRWLGRDAAEIDRLLRPCPAAERACYQEAVWFPQTMLLGTRADMDSIIEAAAKVLRWLEP